MLASQILGMRLITHQTGPEGKIVKRLLVEQGVDIAKEMYVGITLDRTMGMNVLMVSTEGGVEIEKIAAESPEKIVKEHVDPSVGLQQFQARKLAFALGLTGDAFKNGVKFLLALYKAYDATDASLAEINPLVITKGGDVLALDAKINFDDNALYRHPEFAELRDLDEEDPVDAKARRLGINFIHLEGTIGCMVNGAGLAMTTMDLVKHYGGEPANFLDVGGGARHETVCAAMELILADPNVKAILVNIFGGITRGDEVAAGLIEARSEQVREVPMVVRIVGTNAAEAARLLREAKLETAESLDEAAEKAVMLAKGAAR